jgi:hypothetical protein
MLFLIKKELNIYKIVDKRPNRYYYKHITKVAPLLDGKVKRGGEKIWAF